MLYYSNYTNSNNYNKTRTNKMDDYPEQTDIEILMQLNQLNLDRICELEAKVEDLIEIIFGLVRANKI